MTDNRRQILDMLANGKITAEEAERHAVVMARAAGWLEVNTAAG